MADKRDSYSDEQWEGGQDGYEWHKLLQPPIQRFEKLRALAHPAAHRLIRDLYTEPPHHLRLPVYRQMVGHLAYNHVRQQARARRALLDGLRRLRRRFDRARAGVLLAGVFNHQHLSRHVFIALAHFFTDVTEFLATCGAVFFVPAQIMHDALTPEMRG